MAGVKGKLVKGPTKGFLMSRGKFLNGTQKCYYGPGQPPDASPGFRRPHFDDPGFDPSVDPPFVQTDYKPPDDWPAKGSLLCVPQIVFLSPYMTMSNYAYTDFQSAWHGWPADPALLADKELERLTTAFEEAKSTIEALRPNRTYVKVVRWQRFSEDGSGFKRQYNDFVVANQVLGIPSPGDSDPYFGVNFLHIYAGNFAFDTAGDTPEDGALRGENFLVSNEDPDAINRNINGTVDSDTYSNASSDLSDAFPRFMGYAAKLYSSEVCIASGSPDDPPLDWNGFSIDVRNITGFAVGNDLVGQGIFDRLASDLSDFGVTHEGRTSALGSSAAIVSLIAEHFGFDPDTGKDLT